MGVLCSFSRSRIIGHINQQLDYLVCVVKLEHLSVSVALPEHKLQIQNVAHLRGDRLTWLHRSECVFAWGKQCHLYQQTRQTASGYWCICCLSHIPSGSLSAGQKSI